MSLAVLSLVPLRSVALVSVVRCAPTLTAKDVFSFGGARPAARRLRVFSGGVRRKFALLSSPGPEAAAPSRLVPLVTYLSLWYALNGAYNVQNKLVLNLYPYPWIVSWVQLAAGLLFVVPAWATKARQPPKVDLSLLLRFAPIAALHCAGHGLQVSSMGAGSVFFTHVIKATEPFIGMLVLLIFTGTIAPWWVNLCLGPIVGGVAFAALKPGSLFDVSALWTYASIAALGSTVAFAIAKLLAKQLMTKDMKKERGLDAANNYALLTCCSSALLLLPSFLGEGPQALAAFSAMAAPIPFLLHLLGVGFLYYAYNEMGFRVLDLLSPVSAAVANSLKRVVVLLAAVLFLGEDVSRQKIIGAAIAISGVFLYSIAKAKAASLKTTRKVVQVADLTPEEQKRAEDAQTSGNWQP